jgi:ATP-dependent Lhr-like helicase
MSFDVLIQYLVTLAVGDGFDDEQVFFEVKQTHAFRELLPQEWELDHAVYYYRWR